MRVPGIAAWGERGRLPTGERQASAVVYDCAMHLPRSFEQPPRGSMPYPDISISGMAAIGDSVREARRRAGMSQRHLAKVCGLDQSVISRLENGKLANLRWWRFAALVGALGDAWDPGSRQPPGGWW